MRYMIRRIFSPFRDLTRFELGLWLCSVAVVTGAFLLAPAGGMLNLAASLIGVTALIFVAKGYVLGQVLTVVFSVFYGVISFYFRYYGEMATYLGMTAPIAVLAMIEWMRHPYRDTQEVEVVRLTAFQALRGAVLSLMVTAVFYFILKALGTANLAISTLSVTTSFFAAYLVFMRSPFYGLAYASNDAVLILLWVLASMEDASYAPMVGCFSMFLLNDLYGFWNWGRMKRRQTAGKSGL